MRILLPVVLGAPVSMNSISYAQSVYAGDETDGEVRVGDSKGQVKSTWEVIFW